MYNYPAGCVQRPGWVLFTSRGQVGGPCTGGCRGNCSDRPARVSLCALCARLSCSLPSTSGNSARIYCLRQCIRALCEAQSGCWLVTAPSSLRRFAPYKGPASCAVLRLSPHDAAGSLFPCWSCVAWSRTDRCVRPGVEAPGPGFGAAPQQASGDIKTISPLIACR